MIKVVFFGQSTDWELVDLMRMEIEESFLGTHPNAVSEGVEYLSGNSFGLSFTAGWNSPDEIDKETIMSICKYHEVDCSIFLGSDAIKIFNRESAQNSNFKKEKSSNISEKSNKNDIKEFLDKNQVGVLSYDDWVVDVKRENKSKRGAIVFSLILSLLTVLYISVYGFDVFAIIGIIAALFFLTPLLVKDKELTTEAYEVYVGETRSKHEEVKERRAEIKKNIVKLEEEKKKQIDLKSRPFFNKIEKIESNLAKLESIEIHKVGAFKSSLSDLGNRIIEKSNSETLQKFVRVGNFLGQIESHLHTMRRSVISDVKASNLKGKVIFELEKSPKQIEKESLEYLHESLDNSVKFLEGKNKNNFGSYNSGLEKLDNILNMLLATSEKSIDVFNDECEQLKYLESVAVSMLIFLIEGKNVLFFEMLEFFDGLGALDSSWEKKIKEGINGIKISLENLNDSITGLGENMHRMIGQNDLILKELSTIDSSIKFGNLIQTITAYNTYRLRKQID